MSMKDPFEHLPAQSLAVIPMEPETNIAQGNALLGQETISNQQNIVGGNIDVNLIEINSLNGVGLPTVLGDSPVDLIASDKVSTIGGSVQGEKATLSSGSGIVFNRMIDLRNIGTDVGNGFDTNIKLKNGVSLKTGIDIKTENVKNENIGKGASTININLVGPGVTIAPVGKKVLDRTLSSSNTTTTVSTQRERPRFRFMRDPRTGIMTRVQITDQSDGSGVTGQRELAKGRTRSDMDMVRRISTRRDGTLPPEYFTQGAGGRGTSVTFSRVDSRTPAVSTSRFRPRPITPFGDTSGRRPIFPFGISGESVQNTVSSPGVLRSTARTGSTSRTGATGTLLTRPTMRNRDTDRTRSGSGTTVRRSSTGTSTSTGRTQSISDTGGRGGSSRARTVLFLRPGGESRIISTSDPGASSTVMSDIRRMGSFAVPSGFRRFGGTPVAGRGVVPGAVGGAPPAAISGGPFSTPVFGGIGATDMSQMFGAGMNTDFFPGSFAFNGGMSPFSPFVPSML